MLVTICLACGESGGGVYPTSRRTLVPCRAVAWTPVTPGIAPILAV